MAKKTIISDFSALKGKLTFSEKSPDIKVSPKVTPSVVAQKSKISDKGLKEGQSVVLMDSNLRGKIIGLAVLPTIVSTATLAIATRNIGAPRLQYWESLHRLLQFLWARSSSGRH